MDESLRSQIDSNLSHLDGLIRRGRQLRETLAGDSSNKSALVANRAWQQDCGVAINQLSGGSKAHWLARRLAKRFLLRTTSGQVIEAVAPAEIVERLVNVLDQAVVSLSAWVMNMAHQARLRPRRFLGGSISFTTPSFGPLSSKHTPIAGTHLSTAATEWR